MSLGTGREHVLVFENEDDTMLCTTNGQPIVSSVEPCSPQRHQWELWPPPPTHSALDHLLSLLARGHHSWVCWLVTFLSWKDGMGRLMGSTSEHPTVPPNQPCGLGFSGKGKEGGRIGADTAKEKSSTLGVDFSVAALPSPMDPCN